jgi:D-Tyr-tRNAtyr deacylase
MCLDPTLALIDITVDGKTISSIGQGLLVLIGIDKSELESPLGSHSWKSDLHDGEV